jgi:ribonucleoside-diphosphate reductase alpha chain
MRKAKAGQWWVDEGHRRLANNSVAYTEKPDFESFLAEMQSMYESKAGERGIFSRVAAQRIAARNGRRDATREFGTNPCSEIILGAINSATYQKLLYDQRIH